MQSPPRNAAIDNPNSFGWISISLHWLTAALIIALWIIGKNITAMPDGSSGYWRNLHITMGLSTWILLAGRIAWRIHSKHPKAAGLTTRTHRLARNVHYLMLLLLSLLILSGPTVAWLGFSSTLGSAAFWIHRQAGNLLTVLVVFHILGAIKHLMFHEDESIVRMLWPKH